jgi:hypothetical protein
MLGVEFLGSELKLFVVVVEEVGFVGVGLD